MDDHCKYCGSGRAVPILDKRLENSPKRGNKYRAACLECERWLPLASESEFRTHSNPHVLPADAPSDAVHRLVPLEEYDYGPEWAALVGDQSKDQRVLPDGGQINRFECPSCGDLVEGRPEECPHCGGGYKW